MLINKNGEEFTFGRDNFLGGGLPFDTDLLPLGMIVSGSTGSGKTNRVILPLSVALFNLRLRQTDEMKWGGVFIDPKLSFARRLVELIHRFGLQDELHILSEKQSVTINPLLSGLSGQKIAEFLVKSLLAGKPVSVGSGAAYYESRALALLGYIIAVALCAARPCLRLVSEMIDVLTSGGTLDSADPRAADALKRIQIFARGDEREKKMVLDSLQNYLEPFRNDPWKNIFFEYGPFTLDTIRDQGKMLVAAFSPNRVNNLNSGLFLLKMLWYATVMERLSSDFTGNRIRLCVYMVDEFQQIASGSSDADFLAVRREANCAPIFAFQQLSQLETVLPLEWKNILGLLTTKIFLRQSDPDTCFYAEKLGGFLESSVDAVTTTPNSMGVFYAESSRTTTRQLSPRIPAEYFFSLPDGDAVVINDKRSIAWFPAYGMTPEMEKAWRNKKWPERPQLVHPRDFRGE
jgi:type IV secretory pathway TraG/TraD family ATPase VirD4